MSVLPQMQLDHRRARMRVPKPVPKGLDAFLLKAAGAMRRPSGRLAELRTFAEQVLEMRREIQGESSRHFGERIERLRQVFRRRKGDEPMVEGFAVAAEAAWRKLGMEPYPVQIMGAAALGRGWLPEMATGEGKTLTLALAAAVAGWRGWPCHLVTANDYLAQRDAEHLRGFYHECGLSVGSVLGAHTPEARRAAYASDLVYTTSKELLADFLRDRLALGRVSQAARRNLRHWIAGTPAQSAAVMRGIHTAFIDEADNQLIDEAVTPLILNQSGDNRVLVEACRVAGEIACELEEGRDFTIVRRTQAVKLLDPAHDRIAGEVARLPEIFRGAHWLADLVSRSLVARTFYKRGKQYVVEDGKVVIVDEFTGRLMPGRTWRHGLHQAIEALEGLEITAASDTLSQMSFQRFFRHFEQLGGLTGTASEAGSEFWVVYGLPVVPIPTHRPCQREEWPDRFFATGAEKWAAIEAEVVRLHATGRPLLVGTRSISASEMLAERLRVRGLECAVLNATRHREEAQIIAAAGTSGQITIATNMAGRGTDISLGRGVRELGGLHVIATERHESRRIDRQLFGRAGRQGDPGSAQAFVSLEDELLVRFLPKTLRAALKAVPALHGAAVARAQATAQSLSFRQRRGVMETDDWADDALAFAGG